MKKYNVTLVIRLSRQVEANSAKEAQEIARDLGEYDADFERVRDWTAKLIKVETAG